MSNYDLQGSSFKGGLGELKGESVEFLFTEQDSRAAHIDIQSQGTDTPTKHSLPRLRELHDNGSHRARILLGAVSMGIYPELDKEGSVTNRDKFIQKLLETENEKDPDTLRDLQRVLGPKDTLMGI